MSTALSLLGLVGVVFGWTYAQFMAVNAHAAQTDIDVAKVTTSVVSGSQDTKNQGNKIDWLVNSEEKVADRLEIKLDPPPINQ